MLEPKNKAISALVKFNRLLSTILTALSVSLYTNSDYFHFCEENQTLLWVGIKSPKSCEQIFVIITNFNGRNGVFLLIISLKALYFLFRCSLGGLYYIINAFHLLIFYWWWFFRNFLIYLH